MTDPITLAAVSKLLCEVAKSAGEGLATGFVNSSTGNSSAIVQQTKEQAKLMQAQSEYLQRREEREARLESIQIAQLELQSQIAFNQAQRDERRLQLKQEELLLKQQDLQDRRKLAIQQRELMRELHAQAVEMKLTEIQTIWDSENWFSKLSRQETDDILRRGQQQYRLLMLASPPDISEDCPQSFRNNLTIEIQSKLKEFLHQNYPLNAGSGNFSPCPVEFYGDYFKEPISDIRAKQLHKLLAPVPTVVLYSQISDYEVNFHLGYWGLHDDKVSLLPMQAWDWEQAREKLEEGGLDEKKSLRIVRQIIVMVHKLLAAFVVDLYYLYIDATASYEPRLFELEGEFAQEWFPQELVRDYIRILQMHQQRQRDAYEAELKKQPQPGTYETGLEKQPQPGTYEMGLEKLVKTRWKCTSIFKGFDNDLYKLVGINADGSQLVAERSDGKISKAWNLATEKLLTAVELWQSHTGELLRTLEGHSYNVNSIAFSADGQLLASGSSDNTIKLWHPYTGELLQTLEGHSNSVAFSADRQLLASGSSDNTIKLWHPQTGELLRTLEGHSNSVKSVAFSADGQLLASGSSDNTIKLWHPQTGELLRTLEGHSYDVNSIVFSADGQLLASGSDDRTIKLWHPHTRQLLRILEGHSDDVKSVAFSADGQFLASGSDDRTIKLWYPYTGELLRTLEGHSSYVDSVAFSADGQLLASGSRDNTIKLWHPYTGELLRTLEGHSDDVKSVAFSADGQFLASGSQDYTIQLWHSYTLNFLPASGEFRVASPGCDLILKPSYDQTTKTSNLQIIDAAVEELLITLPGHADSIEQVIFSEDGKTMIHLGADLFIKVWRREDG
ncbi:MAG: WD40 repeat domain-containing protein [Trichodesmium sp.]